MRTSFAIVSAVVLAGCARPAAPSADGPPAQQGDGQSQEADVSGTWVHRTMPVTYLETVTLRTSGQQVSGEGTYMMEGGRAGKTSVAGTYAGGVLTLRITRDSGVHESFTGRMESAGRIAGSLSVDGQAAQPFAFERPQAP